MIKVQVGLVYIEMPESVESSPHGVTIREIHSDLLKIIRSTFGMTGTQDIVLEKIKECLTSEYVPHYKVVFKEEKYHIWLKLFKEGMHFYLILE